jgi:ribokinase
MKKIDFLAIGDIVIDAFIKLKDAHVHCKIDTDACELCVPFGDKIPYDSLHVVSAVGNSPNAAVCASRLGLSTALMTNIGDDQNGKDCLAVLEKENIDTTFVKKEVGKLTNYHFVLWYDVDRTILIKHQNYERHWLDTKEASEYTPPTWIYLSSLGEDSLDFHSEILDYLKRNKDVKLAFQPGTFQIKFGIEKLKDIYARTEVFFCNKEEAEKILNIPAHNAFSIADAGGENKVLELSKGIQALGPKIVVISDGSNGAYLYMNEELWHNTIYPDIAPPVDRTGAGDAFSSTFTAALCLGKSPLEAFSWGPINSMSVVQKIGAQEGLLNRDSLEEYLKIAKEDYKITKIN